jgi:hypothetical protein
MIRPFRHLPLLVVALGVLGCTSVREPPDPVAVRELDVQAGGNASITLVPQFWERNTLVVDLQGVPPAGELRLRPRDGGAWPVRLAFRAAPGRFAVVEVQGAQRELLTVSGERGAGVVTMPLAPSVHAGTTQELRVRWGPAEAF